MINLRKITIAAVAAFMLAGCGGGEGSLELSGELKEFSAKNYTISLPEECEVVASEISDLSATVGNCSVSVVSMPTEQATICENKKDFQKKMDSMGYNLKAKEYEKKEIDGVDVYAAEYILMESKIVQYTYIYGDTAYTVTYARPEKYDDSTDKIFEKGLETLKVED